jgi:two-component system chemotaxis response regulator CheY
MDSAMKFLVVDDSATMRRIVINSLQRVGFTNVVEAADGLEALDKLDATIGFVITDWNMPNMGGIDFAREVRARPGFAQLPMLMVTARSVREDIMTALASGLNNYIVKPFTPQVLKEKIDTMLAASAK